jgi:pimeloyl-ACP methyl ester carboxylesterase
MTAITRRHVEINGLRMHLAEAGTGPLVLLLHGFPECWYSWRSQLVALAEAGFHAVAPDQRGYTRTDRPAAAEDYTILHLVGDVMALIDALGERTATVVGHDWGAMVAWQSALLRPDKIRGVAALSVPYTPRGSTPPMAARRAAHGDAHYQVYFQRPGVAEAELEADLDETFRRALYGLSGDSPQVWPMLVPEGGRLVESWPRPERLPAWLTEDDIATYVREFSAGGFTGPLNWYRNIDRNWALTAAWADAPITMSALLLAGDRDPVIAAFDLQRLRASMRAHIRDLRGFELIPGAGHWLQQERPAEVNAALADFAAATATA